MSAESIESLWPDHGSDPRDSTLLSSIVARQKSLAEDLVVAPEINHDALQYLRIGRIGLLCYRQFDSKISVRVTEQETESGTQGVEVDTTFSIADGEYELSKSMSAFTISIPRENSREKNHFAFIPDVDGRLGLIPSNEDELDREKLEKSAKFVQEMHDAFFEPDPYDA
jgi:hypothetical protein